jgi:hypothetical protein
MIQKTYELVCQLPAQAASERIEALLSKEGVKYTAANLFVTSTSTPIAVLGIQSKLYSRSNWGGLNGSMQHSARARIALKTKAKSAG